jgi:hypothetical protein
LLADAPRQCINALTLYSFYLSRQGDGQFWDISKYYSGSVITAGLLVTIIFSVLVFAGSLLMLIAAAILYIPLLCYIQGNLKARVISLSIFQGIHLFALFLGILLSQSRQANFRDREEEE